jgi:hypothetical protein
VLAWNEALNALLAYLGERVELHISPAGSDAVVFAIFKGTLARGEPDSTWRSASRRPDEEAIAFTFAEDRNVYFVLYRSRFEGATDDSTNGVAGLSVEQQGVVMTIWRER